MVRVWASLFDDFTKFSVALDAGLHSFTAKLAQDPRGTLIDLFPRSEIDIVPPPHGRAPSFISPSTPTEGRGLILKSQNQAAEEI